MSEKYEVITYEDIAVFNYSVPGVEEKEQIEREITLVWEDTLEKFLRHTIQIDLIKSIPLIQKNKKIDLLVPLMMKMIR